MLARCIGGNTYYNLRDWFIFPLARRLGVCVMRFALALACICTLIACFSSSPVAADLVIDPAGMQAAGEFNDPGNSTLTFLLTPGATVTGISWTNLAYTAYSPSRINELVFSFTDSTGLNYWDFTVSSLSTPGNF